jgi:hypothetical protein
MLVRIAKARGAEGTPGPTGPAVEIVFLVEEDPEGGLTARALGESIFTEAEDMPALKDAVRDAVRCHFPDEKQRPRTIRLHYVRDEVIAA